MPLRDYQERAIEAVRKQWLRGARRVLLVQPTGSGKTWTCTEMVRRAVANGRRCLWLAHRAELIDQAADTLAAAGLTVGAVCATARTPPNPFAPVQVASVQTLLARNQRPPADLIVFDEAHHACEAAESWSALLNDYSKAHIVGPTATPERGDGSGMRGTFDAIVVGAEVRELMDAGHLVPCQILRPDKPLAPGQIAQNPVDAYVEYASSRRAIVFARSVALSESYAQEFNLRGITARTISADTPWGERKLYLDAFKAGKIQVLVNVYVLTEGFDDPGVSCCILARGCGSAGMYLQMIGRILRPAPGKKDALLLDLRGASFEHGEPDSERSYSLDGKGLRLRDQNSYCPVCGSPRTPPEACPSCGYSPSGEDGTKPDKVTGDRLVPYAHKRQENDEQRIATLVRWLRVADQKGYRQGWVRAKWKAVYDCALSGNEIAMAREIMHKKIGAA